MRRRDFIAGVSGAVSVGIMDKALAAGAPCPPPAFGVGDSSIVQTPCTISSWQPPYQLPGPGEVVEIGTNTAMSVVPSSEGWGTGSWDYSNFGSYGGGVFVPVYSEGGAWVACGTGGHRHPDNHGALLFDFEDATWKRLDNANGIRRLPSPHYYSVSQTTGGPYYEISGSVVPAPGHPYTLNNFLPQGQRGSIILVTRAGLAAESWLSNSVHAFDLHTRVWSRFTTSLAPRTSFEADALYDGLRNRYWLLVTSQHDYNTVAYLDLNDKSWKTTAAHPNPSSVIGQNYSRCFMHDGLIMRLPPNGTLWYFDPDNAAAGWGQCVVSGSLPSGSPPFPQNSFVRYSNGNYYHKSNGSGNRLTRLVPPGNPKTGTWTASAITLSGPTLPAYSPTYGEGQSHYKNLVYVPSIDCLAWVPGGYSRVFLIRPAA